MADREPRLFLEAVEREARDAGLQTIRRYARPHDPHCSCTALLVAEDIDGPAKVIPVDERGTIAIADTMFLHGARCSP